MLTIMSWLNYIGNLSVAVFDSCLVEQNKKQTMLFLFRAVSNATKGLWPIYVMGTPIFMLRNETINISKLIFWLSPRSFPCHLYLYLYLYLHLITLIECRQLGCYPRASLVNPIGLWSVMQLPVLAMDGFWKDQQV